MYRFTGENFQELEKICNKIILAIEMAGHTCFCSISREEYYQRNNFTRKQIYIDLINETNNNDAVLAVVTSNDKSEGMLVETGYAFAKGKRIILAIKKGVRSEMIEYMAEKIIVFDTLEELCEKLSGLKEI